MIFPCILSGGIGSRLWPLSRKDRPKQFLPIFNGESLFQKTCRRVHGEAFASPIVIGNNDHRFLIGEQLAEIGVEANTILLEPMGRNTAAPAAMAAIIAAEKDPDALILLLPSDHLIGREDVCLSSVQDAATAARAGRIVTFGITPSEPNTGYGYIRLMAGQDPVREVEAFVEKPDIERARAFLADGYLWNSGIFQMSVATALEELETHVPAVLAAARAAVAGARGEGDVLTLDADAFAKAPKISFDHAVMEKTARAAVVDAGFDWSDLGTWSAVWDADAKDADGNVATGDVTLLDTKNAYVNSSRPRVGVVGLSDAVVVASDDAVLVTTRAHADRVKDLAAAIEKAPEAVFGDFARHYRPWGHYQSLDQGAGHQVKRIVVIPGARLSLQKHAHRAEHWTVVAGVAEVTLGMERDALKQIIVRANETVHIPLGAIHRLANPGDVPLVLIEVQVGDYLGEDDIVRLEDDYGR